MNKVLIHYFLGTGNTYHAMHVLAKALERRDYEVSFSDMERPIITKQQTNPDGFELHVFACPVYGFGIPAIVRKYIKRLIPVKGCHAAVLSIGGQSRQHEGFEGYSLSNMARILKRKGYAVFYRALFCYPINWTQVMNPLEDNDRQRIFQQSDGKIEALAQSLVNMESHEKTISTIVACISWLVYMAYGKIGRRILGKLFIADDACVGCGICENICPVQNIRLQKGLVRWGWKCEGCQRCINRCPTNAVQVSVLRLLLFVAVEIIPVFVLIRWSALWAMPVYLKVLLGFMLYVAGSVVLHWILDVCMFLLEKAPLMKRLLSLSYTKKFRRYVVKEFKPE